MGGSNCRVCEWVHCLSCNYVLLNGCTVITCEFSVSSRVFECLYCVNMWASWLSGYVFWVSVLGLPVGSMTLSLPLDVAGGTWVLTSRTLRWLTALFHRISPLTFILLFQVLFLLPFYYHFLPMKHSIIRSQSGRRSKAQAWHILSTHWVQCHCPSLTCLWGHAERQVRRISVPLIFSQFSLVHKHFCVHLYYRQSKKNPNLCYFQYHSPLQWIPTV